MAAVTKGTRPSMADLAPGSEHFISGYVAGEIIAAGDFCYKKAADGKIWKATGAAANEAAGAWGMSLDDAAVGDAVTLVCRVKVGYKPLVGGNPAPTNALLYLSTAGGLQDAASTGDAVGVARVMDADGLIFIRCSP